MPRALIAGSGYVGTRLAELLAEQGHEVFALRRGEVTPPAGVTSVSASLLQPEELARHRRSYDWLFFTAGPDAISEEAYRQTFVRGLGNALDAFGDDSARIVLVSSTAVYGQTSGEAVDETSVTEPTHFSGKVLLEAEASLAERRSDAVVLRLGGIYGPARSSMLDAVRRGAATYVDGEESVVNRFHRDDCAGALLHLARLDSPERSYLGVDDAPASRREVLAFIAEELGAPAPRAVPRPSEPRRRAATNKRCSNARLAASGYRLLYPTYREGYRSLIEAERAAQN